MYPAIDPTTCTRMSLQFPPRTARQRRAKKPLEESPDAGLPTARFNHCRAGSSRKSLKILVQRVRGESSTGLRWKYRLYHITRVTSKRTCPMTIAKSVIMFALRKVRLNNFHNICVIVDRSGGLNINEWACVGGQIGCHKEEVKV
jgi:hypothetical protein